MKLKTILSTLLISTTIVSNAQILNGVLNGAAGSVLNGNTGSIINTAKDAVLTNSAAVIGGVLANPTGAIDKAKDLLNIAKPGSLTNDEVINGLKEALNVGTTNSSGAAAKLDGYLKNPAIFIPWPAEAQAMKDKLVKLGMKKKVTDFETSLNRAAEEAAKKAAPVFINAITGMSIGDGFAILKGADSSATNYLRVNTYAPLKEQFMPLVKEAIAKTKVTNNWKPLATAYNKIPGVKKQNPNLDDYVCNKAINGLMTLIMAEEAKIRQNPAAQVSDLLKKVFGSVMK